MQHNDIAWVIFNLLRTEEVVILPGFGGLVTRYVPARVHPTSHVFHPPHREVSFNARLTSHDGLLEHALAVQTGCSIPEARNIVAEFVAGLTGELSESGSALIEGVGTLQQDVEGKLQFRPVRSEWIDPSSFGLPVIRTHSVVVPLSASAEKEVFIPSEPAPAKSGRKLWWLPAAVLIISLVGIQLLTGNKGNIELASYGFGKAEVFQGKAYQAELPGLTDIASAKEVSSLADTQIEEDDNSIQINWQAEPVCYVVAGAFTESDNAENLSISLQEKGLEVIRLQQGRYTMVVLPVFSESSRNSLRADLIQRSGIRDAWIMYP